VTRSRLTPRRAFLLGWLTAFLIGSAWALVSPMGSSPDEPSHILKAEATVRGQFTGTPTKIAGNQHVVVPRDIAEPGGNIRCYRFDATMTPACVPARSTANGDALVTQNTHVGGYDPLYYAVVGLPSLVFTGNHAWYAMRIVNALLDGFFIGILFFVAAQLRRTPAFLAWVAVALTPMTLYLTGMVNPNGVEIVGCAALAALAWLVVSDRSRTNLRSRMTLLAVVGVVAGSARSLSPAYVALILVAVVLSFPLRRSADLLRSRAVVVGLVVGVVGLVAAGLWTILVTAPAGLLPTNTPRDGFLRAFTETLRQTSSYGRQMIGELGWLDTQLPGVVYVGWTVGIGFLVVAVVLLGARATTRGALLLMLAVLFVPAIVQAPSVKTFGYVWQGRYTLPIFVATVLVAGLVVERALLRRIPAVRVVAVLGSAAAFGQCAAWFTAYKRYAVGTQGSWRDLLHATTWAPPGGLVPATAVFAVGTLGMLVLSIVIASALSRSRRDDVPTRPQADRDPSLLESPGADPRTEDPRGVGVHPGPAR
jgi:hypothetical protein